MAERSEYAENSAGVLPRRRVAVGLGSNWGSAREIVVKAVEALGRQPGLEMKAVSRFRETRPIGGPPSQPRFVNAVALVETELPPTRLLEILHQVEQQFGRQREGRWAPRTLDLDILIDEAGPVCEPGLLVPHPRLGARRFFLEALAELYPQAWHFWSGLSVGRIVGILREAAPWLVVVFETFPVENRTENPPAAAGPRVAFWQEWANSLMQGLGTAERAFAEDDPPQGEFCLLGCDQHFELARRLGISAVEGSAVLAWWQELEDRLAAGRTVVTGLPPLLPDGVAGSVASSKPEEAKRAETESRVHRTDPVASRGSPRRGIRLHPRVVVLGPLAAHKEFWHPAAAAGEEKGAPATQRPLWGSALVHRAVLSRIRRTAPVVIVESEDPRDWAAHIAAAYEASRESGVIL